MHLKPTLGHNWIEKQVCLNQTSNWHKMVVFARFEFSKDQKRSRKATNVFFNWQRSSKVPKHSPKILCCGVVSHLNVYIHLAYYNRYKCLETPQLHLLGQDILSQMSNLTFMMQKTYTFDTQGVKYWQKTKKKRSHKRAKIASQ